MCVCTSIRPGNPVYFERSIVSAPAGIADASVVTLRIRSPSTSTMAFVQSWPLASQSFPKRTALTVLVPGFSCAQNPPTYDAPRTAARRILIGFMEHSPLHLHTHAVHCLTSNSVVDGMQSRRTAGLQLATSRLRGCRFLQGRRTHGRHGRRYTRGLGAKPQLLKGFRIELSRRIQPMRFLEFSRRFHCRSVPFPVRFSSERTVFRERLLDLGNAVGSRGFLSSLPTL